MANLQVHHMKPRSRLGGDVQENLITLCAERSVLVIEVKIWRSFGHINLERHSRVTLSTKVCAFAHELTGDFRC
jgi:HNH endonuclease